MALAILTDRFYNIFILFRPLGQENRNILLKLLRDQDLKQLELIANSSKIKNPSTIILANLIRHLAKKNNGKRSSTPKIKKTSQKEMKDFRALAQERCLFEIENLEKYLPSLYTIATVSPLLGILGTVTGMIKSFQALAQGKSATLLGGIDEALITTAMGLAIAIPALVMHNYFVKRIQLYEDEINFFVGYLLEAIDSTDSPDKVKSSE